MLENSTSLENLKKDLKEEFMQNSRYVEGKITDLEGKFEDKISSMQSKIESIEERMKAEIEKRLGALVLRSGQEEATASTPEASESSTTIVPEISHRNAMPPTESKTTVVSESLKIRIKPPQFDGKTSWQNYLLQFEAAAQANGWTLLEKATALTLSLRGDVTNVLQTISPADRTNYQQLIKHLDMRFGQAHLEHVYHSQLKNRYKKTNETLQEYEADIARLVRLAYSGTPENVMERLAVQAFLDGLRDDDTRQALTLNRPALLVDALARALKFEAAKSTNRNKVKIRMMDSCSEETPDDEVESTVMRILDKVMEKNRTIRTSEN